MNDILKYGMLLIIEIIVWIFFIKMIITKYDQTIFLICVMIAFMVGRHFTMFMDIAYDKEDVK